MASRRRRFLSILLLGLLIAAAPGCRLLYSVAAIPLRLIIPDTTKHKAEFKIDGRSIVVIPFKDKRRGYFESRDGLDLSAAVMGELGSRPGVKAKVMDPQQVRLAFPNQRLEDVGWAKIGKQVGADLVMFGDIETFTLKRPGYIGVLQGNCRMKVYIYDVKDGTIPWSKTLQTWWPESGPPVAASDVEAGEFRQQLIAFTAFKLAQSFYNWEEKMRPPPRRY